MKAQIFVIKCPTLLVELVDNISDRDVANEGDQKFLSVLTLTSSALL